MPQPLKSFVPTAENARAFRDALGQFATGVTLVTCDTENGPLGITANSFASVSIDPPLVLWSPARSSRRFDAFASADHFTIHVLSSEQRTLCENFVRDGGAFDEKTIRTGPNGTPIISGALAIFDCRRHASHDGGDHAIIVGEVLSVERNAGDPLVFSSGRFGRFSEDT